MGAAVLLLVREKTSRFATVRVSSSIMTLDYVDGDDCYDAADDAAASYDDDDDVDGRRRRNSGRSVAHEREDLALCNAASNLNFCSVSLKLMA